MGHNKLKTEDAIKVLKLKDEGVTTPLLTWDAKKIEDFIPIYKNDEYHAKYYRTYEKHLDTFWTKEEVSIAEDFPDWNGLMEQDRELILNILRIFTQADATVLDGYNHMISIFSPVAIKMMLGDFMSRECIHIDAYSVFTDTLGMDGKFYKEFLEIPEMSDKFYFVDKAKVKKDLFYYEEAYRTHILEIGENAKPDIEVINENARTLYIQDVIRMLVCYSLFMEGIELFAMFSILFSYRVKLGKMRRLATIVEWSIRDESQHVSGNAELINDIIKENPHVMTEELINDIYGMLNEVLVGQERYINLIYANYEHIGERITKEDVMQFNRYIGNLRLKQINLKVDEEIANPFPWLDELLLSPTLTNFFSDVVTEYGRDLKGDKNSIRSNLGDFKDLLEQRALAKKEE